MDPLLILLYYVSLTICYFRQLWNPLWIILSLDLLFHFLLNEKKELIVPLCCEVWGVANLGHWLAKLGCCPCKWKGGWSWLLDLECEAMIKKQNNDPSAWVPMDEDMVYVATIEFPLEDE